MLEIIKENIKIPKGWLAWKIVFWVFASVIVIETLIFIPSFKMRRKELLQQLHSVSAARVDTIMRMVDNQASGKDLLSALQRLMVYPAILGGALYHQGESPVGVFGETPTLMKVKPSPGMMVAKLSADATRYDVACTSSVVFKDYTLILRHDTSSVNKGLHAFIWRIAGLVILISFVVTAGAWIALVPIVITPILGLRRDLISAGEAISKDKPAPAFTSANINRKDELGDMVVAFRQMHQQISDAIRKRKHAEEALQKSFKEVADYSNALNRELEQGRQIQKNFLPDKLIDIPGWETAAFFQPARQVSGDFYDVFKLPDGSVGFVIADVCDKGVGAALFMALCRSLIRVYFNQVYEASEGVVKEGDYRRRSSFENEMNEGDIHKTDVLNVVTLTDDYIDEFHGELGMFATLFLCRLDPASGVLSYVNGGHIPILILDSTGAVKQQLMPTGPAIGLAQGSRFKVGYVHLFPGDTLFGYTDGVTEASANGGAFYGNEKLQNLLATSFSSVDELIGKVARSVMDHTGNADLFDDVTMLALRRKL